MNAHLIEQALAAASDTKALEIGRGVLSNVPRIFVDQFGERAAAIIADPRTMTAAGNAVDQALRAAGVELHAPLVFKYPDLYAEMRFVDLLEAWLKDRDAIPIAVGSGTINDLTKLAAHRTGRPYMAVATAASMDGYTAYGASITFHGSKQTFECPAPRAVVADLDVLCAAPAAMTASGYADLLAKVTAGADWLVADALGVEAIDAKAWELVQDPLRASLDNPAGLKAGDVTAMQHLATGLMMGGFAMQWSRTSRPASGAEHQFSHLWDMEHHTFNGQPPSHGFKVAIGTQAVVGLYERLLAMPLDQLDVERACAAWPDAKQVEQSIRRLFDIPELLDKARLETAAKAIDRTQLRQQLERLRQVWPDLRRRLRRQLIPLPELRRMLQTVGAPTRPEQIGISSQRLRESFLKAYYIRRRFTVLDLAMRTGMGFKPDMA